LGQHYHWAVLFQAPYLSLYTAEQIIYLVVATFLADVGIDFHCEAVSGACTSAKTLKGIFLDLAWVKACCGFNDNAKMQQLLLVTSQRYSAGGRKKRISSWQFALMLTDLLHHQRNVLK
jgi:hypothetical protein